MRGVHGVGAASARDDAAVVHDRRLDRPGAEVDAEDGHQVTCTPESIDHMSGRVVVVGSLNQDIVVGLERMPDSGETVFGHSLERHAGGKGLNQAVAAARVGAPVSMIGAVSQDSAGDFLLRVVEEEGIDDATIARVEGFAGTAVIEVDDAGANRIVVIPGANALLTAEHVTAAIDTIPDVAIVLTQGEVPADAVAAALAAGRARGATTILNPAPVQEYPDEVWALVDIAIPNEHETELLTGHVTGTSADATAAARILAERGAGTVIVTRGAKGSVWATLTTSGSSGAFTVRPVDTVAAGDAFCGALAAALADGRSLSEALRWGSAAGALAATKAGAVPSLPMRDEVEHLVNAG
jgi:ribokinase